MLATSGSAHDLQVGEVFHDDQRHLIVDMVDLGARPGASSLCLISAWVSKRIRSRVSGQDSPATRRYGNACLSTTDCAGSVHFQ